MYNQSKVTPELLWAITLPRSFSDNLLEGKSNLFSFFLIMQASMFISAATAVCYKSRDNNWGFLKLLLASYVLLLRWTWLDRQICACWCSCFECLPLADCFIYSGMIDFKIFWDLFKPLTRLLSCYNLLSDGIFISYHCEMVRWSHSNTKEHTKLNKVKTQYILWPWNS